MTTTTDDDRQPELTELARHVESGGDPLGRLEALSALLTALDSLRPALVAAARGQGASDAEVARRLGISRQAVTKRYPRGGTEAGADGSAVPAPRPGQRSVPELGPSPLSRPRFGVTTPGGRVLLRVNRVDRRQR